MKKVFTKTWWKAAGVRAIKTMAQTAAATIGTTTVITKVDWLLVVSTTFTAGLLSILTSIGGLPETYVEEDEDEQLESEVE